MLRLGNHATGTCTSEVYLVNAVYIAAQRSKMRPSATLSSDTHMRMPVARSSAAQSGGLGSAPRARVPLAAMTRHLVRWFHTVQRRRAHVRLHTNTDNYFELLSHARCRSELVNAQHPVPSLAKACERAELKLESDSRQHHERCRRHQIQRFAGSASHTDVCGRLDSRLAGTLFLLNA